MYERERKREREKERERERERERDRDRHTDRERDRETERERGRVALSFPKITHKKCKLYGMYFFVKSRDHWERERGQKQLISSTLVPLPDLLQLHLVYKDYHRLGTPQLTASIKYFKLCPLAIWTLFIQLFSLA